jgi:ATP-binding cassette, subfamily G (WHITE), eye pigment precursor transporter
MLSTVCPSYPIAISVAGPILTILSLTGGLYANVGELPKFISWVRRSSPKFIQQ